MDGRIQVAPPVVVQHLAIGLFVHQVGVTPTVEANRPLVVAGRGTVKGIRTVKDVHRPADDKQEDLLHLGIIRAYQAGCPCRVGGDEVRGGSGVIERLRGVHQDRNGCL